MPWHGGMVLGGMVLDLWGSLSLSLSRVARLAQQIHTATVGTDVLVLQQVLHQQKEAPGVAVQDMHEAGRMHLSRGRPNGPPVWLQSDPPTRADQAVPPSEDRSGTEPGACRQRTRPLM